MTKKDAVRIDLGHVTYRSAETSAFDLHCGTVLSVRLKAQRLASSRSQHGPIVIGRLDSGSGFSLQRMNESDPMSEALRSVRFTAAGRMHARFDCPDFGGRARGAARALGAFVRD